MTVTAVVVGGANGIGAAVTADQRAGGANVVVWDIDDGADIACDISDPAAVERAAAETIADVGVPDLVTITAGIGHSAFLLDASADEWDHVLNTNTRGVWLAMREFAGPMIEGDGGSIVAISSISARLSDRFMGLYCISKAALDMLIAVSAAEWGPTVRVNGVAPGVTETAMLGGAPAGSGWLAGVQDRTAMRRLGKPEDIAEAVRSVHAATWTTGEVLRCDGGLSLFSPISPVGDYS